jgi:hypothetical protein
MLRIYLLLSTLAFFPQLLISQTQRTPDEVVREEVNAFTAGDVDRLLSVFHPDARIFGLPSNLDRLVGPLSARAGTESQRASFFGALLRSDSRPRTEIVDTVVVGDLAAVVLRDSEPPDFGRDGYLFSIRRVTDGRVVDLWQVAASDTMPRNVAAEDVIRRFVAASNRGDVEAFLSFFSADSKDFRGADDPHGLADKLLARMSSVDSRRATISAAFRSGPAGQAEIVDLLSFADFVVSRDRVTLPGGRLVHQMKIYRVRDGLITHDWTAYERVE